MKNEWYTDKKDIVKWGGVADLLGQYSGAVVLLYVPMLRDSDPLPHLALNGSSPRVIHPKVAEHFRDIVTLKHLAASLGAKWSLVQGNYVHASRASYFRRATERIRRLRNRYHLVVLIDPDNGVAPRREPDDPVVHVQPDDIEKVFGELASGDALAIYQHINRNLRQPARVRASVSHACNRVTDALLAWPTLAIEDYTCPELTTEAVLLAVRKP